VKAAIVLQKLPDGEKLIDFRQLPCHWVYRQNKCNFYTVL